MDSHLHPLHNASHNVLALNCSLKTILPAEVYQRVSAPHREPIQLEIHSHMYILFLRSCTIPVPYVHNWSALYERQHIRLAAQRTQGIIRARWDGYSLLSWFVKHSLYSLAKRAEMVSRCSFWRKSSKLAAFIGPWNQIKARPQLG